MGRAPEKEKPVNHDLVAELGKTKLLVVLVLCQSWRTEGVCERGYEDASSSFNDGAEQTGVQYTGKRTVRG